MAARLEHANLNVRDIDGVIRFLQTAFPEFRVRHEGVTARGSRWVHVGTDESYVALNPTDLSEPPRGEPYAGRPGLNHLGFEVDDADAVRERLRAAGYRESTPPNNHPHRKRVYFYDSEGNDWEFVEYLSDDRTKRHDYELADI